VPERQVASARELDAVFAALADPTRRDVVRALGAAPTSASELASRMPVSRQAIAKHLALLAAAGLVDSARDGRQVRYRLTPGAFSDAVAWMTDVGAAWDARLAALRRHVT
jgi:ArsR family transcriptional regulator, cadmium/lead-responsive transcriptional repressor